MPEMVEVESAHIVDELMHIRFAHSQLVSDHPRVWGGSDTGPAPGDIILMSLASASALAGRQFATRNQLDVGHVGARLSLTTVQEGFPEELRHVSLPQLTYVQRFWRRLEVDGRLSDFERDALIQAMAENRVAKTVRNGIELEERLICHQSDARKDGAAKGGSRAAANRSDGHRLLRDRMAPGETRVVTVADTWRVSAFAPDDQTCLVKAAASMSVVGDRVSSQRGPTPEELLLGGLASCTNIYLARNAMFQNIAVESVHVRARALIPEDPTEPITHVEKVAEVVGEFTDEEIAKLEHYAQFCAFGVTLSRGTEVADSVAINDAEQSQAVPSPFQALDRLAPTPDDAVFCDDKSCCVPTAAQ
jgi:uncharacterized OsmC-like protein